MEDSIFNKLNSYWQILAILSAMLLSILTVVYYVFRWCYCRYFSIPVECVSFSLDNNFISIIFYFVLILIYLLICFCLILIINQFVKNKLINFFISISLLSFITLFLLNINFYVLYDYYFQTFIYDKYFCKIVLAVLFFSCILYFVMQSYWISVYIYDRFISIFNSFRKSKVEIKDKNNKKPQNVKETAEHNKVNMKKNIGKVAPGYNTTIVFIVIIVVIVLGYILGYAATSGRDIARNKREFDVVKDYKLSEKKYIKLYSESGSIIVAPFIMLSTNSIIIDNRSIIKMSDIDICYSNFNYEHVELVKNADGSINHFNGIEIDY